MAQYKNWRVEQMANTKNNKFLVLIIKFLFDKYTSQLCKVRFNKVNKYY